MSSRILAWTDEAWDSYVFWQRQDKKTLKRINKLIKAAKSTPFDGIGKPEPVTSSHR
ncbi:MAG TPA: type II toxin-antitoxin system YoeB family toxin [Coleofasciculaceae cyanobacterium]|jgi:toxin YoeB